MMPPIARGSWGNSTPSLTSSRQFISESPLQIIAQPVWSFPDTLGIADATLWKHLLSDMTGLLGRLRMDGDGAILSVTDDVDAEGVGKGAASKKEKRCDCEDGGFHYNEI